jgi:hypothetical protein
LRPPDLRRAGLVALALLMVPACDVHEPVVIPPGASTVRVLASEDGVVLTPATAPAGDVYLVLDGPDQGIEFVSRLADPDGSPEGMTQDQIDAVAAGDFQSTMLEGFSVTCGADEWTFEQRWEGCGENVKLTLTPGFYAVLAGAEEPGVAPVMAVLEVTP